MEGVKASHLVAAMALQVVDRVAPIMYIMGPVKKVPEPPFSVLRLEATMAHAIPAPTLKIMEAKVLPNLLMAFE